MKIKEMEEIKVEEHIFENKDISDWQVKEGARQLEEE